MSVRSKRCVLWMLLCNLAVAVPASATEIEHKIVVNGQLYSTLNAAWSAAVSEASQSGTDQTIFLSSGNFPVTATLAEPANGVCVNIIGFSGTSGGADVSTSATTISAASGISGDLINLLNASASNIAEGCTFRDFTVLGNKLITHAFELQWFRALAIENVTINDTTSDAILLGEVSGTHNAVMYLRNVTISYSASAFTPANRPNYGLNMQATVYDSYVDSLIVRNALQAAVYNAGGSTTFNLIHGFGYPYTCTTPPCNNQETNASAPDASYATNWEVIDYGHGGNMYFNTYMDSPALAAFDLHSNGVQVNGGHIEWPDVTSFPYASFAVVEASVTSNIIFSNVDCLNMPGGAGYGPSQGAGVWVTYLGNPPQYSTLDNLAGCGDYFQTTQSASVTAFDRSGNSFYDTNASANNGKGQVPRVWASPLSSAANYAAFAAQLYTGYLGDMYVGAFDGHPSIFNVTYQGTVRTAGGLALSTVMNTAATLALTTANKNVLANAASGAQTIMLPDCSTNMPDGVLPTGLEITIYKIDTTTNTVTINSAASGQNIFYSGTYSASLAITAPGATTLVCGPDYNWYAR